MRVLPTVYKIPGGMAHLLKGKTPYQKLEKANLVTTLLIENKIPITPENRLWFAQLLVL